MEQLYSVSSLCLDDHHFKEEEFETVGALSKVCSQIVLKCMYLARIGRPDVQWSVHKLARAVTKRTRACDRRLARLISYVHGTSCYCQSCGKHSTTMQTWIVSRLWFCGRREDSKSTSLGVLCIFGSHTFVPTSWMCKKQTSVSHRSTEAEIISPDAGLRMDGIPALTLWDLVIQVFHYVPNRTGGPKRKSYGETRRQWSSQTCITPYQSSTPASFQHTLITFIPSNTKNSDSSAMLYVFEENKAVIKMVFKGRSPAMRHVSRTHRVFLIGCLREWTWKIQIRYIDTQHQIADILTKGNFTRDEWNNILHVFNISHFSSLCCAKNFSLISCTKRVAKRMQEQKEDNRIVVKSKPTAMNLAGCSSNSPLASKSLGYWKPQVGRFLTQKEIATQRRVLKDGKEDARLDVCTGKAVAADEDQESLNYPETVLTGSRDCRQVPALQFVFYIVPAGLIKNFFESRKCTTRRRGIGKLVRSTK